MEWKKVFSGVNEAGEKVPRGTIRRIIIKSHVISLAHVDDDFYAFEDSCPHKSVSLKDGTINYLGEIVCPLHNYQYDLKTGRECNSRTRDLKIYRIQINDEGFFIEV